MTEQSISLERLEDTISVFGSFDENIRLIEAELGVSVVNRDGSLKIAGENGENVIYGVKAIEGLLELSGRGEPWPPGGSPLGNKTSAMSSSWSGRAGRSRSTTWRPTCCASRPRASPSRPRPWGRRSISRPFRKM